MDDGPNSFQMPVLFVGHGSPMNAIEDNSWSRGFRALGEGVPLPRAILAVSAHWYVDGTFLTASTRPETIHDFGGFPEPLYKILYPAPGDPALARRATALLGLPDEVMSSEWGIDHGTWSVLLHMFPKADIPVVQLSIDAGLPPREHLAMGRALGPLRYEGVLIMASGNIVHNLRDAFGQMRRGTATTPRWATGFDADVARALEDHDTAFLSRALKTEEGQHSHPTPDHYLPLLYAVGAAEGTGTISFPIVGFDVGSLSMRAVIFG